MVTSAWLLLLVPQLVSAYSIGDISEPEERPICQTDDWGSDELGHKNFKLLEDDCGRGSQDSYRIIKGTDAEQGEFPWMAQLMKEVGTYSIFQCGGSLINKRYVITAAHCYADKTLVYKVAVGSHNHGGGREMTVDYFIIHENYNVPNKQSENDIALARLKNPLRISSYVKPICLPISKMFQSGKYEELPVLALGFGVSDQSKGYDQFPSVLQKVTLHLLSHSSCENTYYNKKRTVIGPKQMCTSLKNGRDPCNGDSGGPLMTLLEDRYYLTGIISGVCGQGLPTVHTKVTSYLTWILDNMKR